METATSDLNSEMMGSPPRRCLSIWGFRTGGARGGGSGGADAASPRAGVVAGGGVGAGGATASTWVNNSSATASQNSSVYSEVPLVPKITWRPFTLPPHGA